LGLAFGGPFMAVDERFCSRRLGWVVLFMRGFASRVFLRERQDRGPCASAWW